jgi:hypothetical protein
MEALKHITKVVNIQRDPYNLNKGGQAVIDREFAEKIINMK